VAIGLRLVRIRLRSEFRQRRLKNKSGSFVVPSSYTIGLGGATGGHLSASKSLSSRTWPVDLPVGQLKLDAAVQEASKRCQGRGAR